MSDDEDKRPAGLSDAEWKGVKASRARGTTSTGLRCGKCEALGGQVIEIHNVGTPKSKGTVRCDNGHEYEVKPWPPKVAGPPPLISA